MGSGSSKASRDRSEVVDSCVSFSLQIGLGKTRDWVRFGDPDWGTGH